MLAVSRRFQVWDFGTPAGHAQDNRRLHSAAKTCTKYENFSDARVLFMQPHAQGFRAQEQDIKPRQTQNIKFRVPAFLDVFATELPLRDLRPRDFCHMCGTKN